MEIEGSYAFNSPIDQVFSALIDPDTLRASIPGCEKFEPIDADVFAVAVRIGVAAVKGSYGGTVRLKDVSRPSQYTLEAEGTSGPGFVKASVLMRLEPDGDHTLLKWTADTRIGGRIASVGARMLGGIASHTANQFFKNLEERIPAS
jgi:carbon monoxide dehydrogenase subunit G